MYEYEKEKPKLFTDEGQRDFLKVRDNVQKLLALAGAVRFDKAVSVISGDGWFMLACVDRLVELGELRAITDDGVRGQDAVFVKVR
jgi:hypothetical protein